MVQETWFFKLATKKFNGKFNQKTQMKFLEDIMRNFDSQMLVRGTTEKEESQFLSKRITE